MSEHYEVVVSCFLRAETPADVLEALRWHLGTAGAQPAVAGADQEPDPFAFPLLEPDPDSPLPGGDAGVLRAEDHHAWGLFSRTHWHEDDLGHLETVLRLLAPYVAEPGYGGHLRATTAAASQPDALPCPVLFSGGSYTLSVP